MLELAQGSALGAMTVGVDDGIVEVEDDGACVFHCVSRVPDGRVHSTRSWFDDERNG